MATGEVQRLELKDLDAVLERAKAEGWTELAICPSRPQSFWNLAHVILLGKVPFNLPPSFFEITSLKKIELTRSRLSAKDIENFALLDQLNTIYLLDCGADFRGAAALKYLPELNKLCIDQSQLGNAGLEILSELIELKELSVVDNYINDIGAIHLKKLANLLSLNLAGNSVGNDGAQAIADLKQLRSLNLSSAKVGPLGVQAIATLTDLSSLDLTNNLVGDAGAQMLAGLTELRSLKLSGSGIQVEGARAIAELPRLSSLNLSRNNIGDAGAAAVARVSSLTSLDLRENNIGEAGAKEIAKHTGLSSLNLQRNQILEAGARALLDAWANPTTSDRRQLLDLRGNRNLGGLLAAELLEQADAQALIAVWRRFREAEAKGELRPLNEAKVLVLGNEGVGKTSLVRYLVDRVPRDDSEPKTAGIVIRRDVPIEDWSAEESGVRLHFWDFGGQEIMHQTHRYFLTRRSLYLVVLEDRREDDRSVYDWLKVIRSRGGESPVLVVINKCDQGTPNLRLDETSIRAAYPNVLGFVAVSCKPDSEERIAGLRQQIAGLVSGDPRLKHVRDPFPPEQLRVKRAVAVAAEEARYLDRAAFIQLCEAADEPASRITDPALQRSLLQLLHDLGTVVAHGLERERSDAAREVTLLDPNWLTEAIYRLLNSKRILDQDGEFGRDEMAAELDPERYPPERHGYIVDMMQEHEIGLCFRLPGQGERWLMPECLTTNGPDVEVFFENTLRFRFTYDFLPIGLMPRFIVETYNKSTDQPTRWRTGVLLGTAGCKVLVRADLDRSRIELAVTGPEARRRSALAAVLHDLEVVHQIYPEIGTEARVPLPDDPEVDVGYADLSKWEAVEGANYSFWPEKAARKYTVGELLAGVRVEGGRQMVSEEVVPPTVASPTQGLAGFWWFPLACGAAAMALAVLLMLLPTNEWQAVVGGVAGVGIIVTLVATHFAPGRFYRRMMAWTVSGGFLIHMAGFSAEAGFWGDSAARLQWDGRVSVGFSVAWMVIVVGLIVADLKQSSK